MIVKQDSNISPAEILANFERDITGFLSEFYPSLRLRLAVRESLLFKTTTISDLLSSPSEIEGFLKNCHALPQCGNMQIRKLEAIFVELYCRYSEIMTNALCAADENSSRMHPAEIVASGKFYPDFLAASQNVFQRFWRLAHFKQFVYLPSSIPEFFKTRAVLQVESGTSKSIDTYLEHISQLANSIPMSNAAQGKILLDGRALDAIFQRHGRYKQLHHYDVLVQREALERMLSVLPGNVHVRVADFESADLSCLFLVGDTVVLHILGGYFVIDSPVFRMSLALRCDSAWSSALSLDHYLQGLN